MGMIAGKKVIAFSLYGDTPRYTVGAVRNVELAGELYPEWECRVYCDPLVPPDILSRLGNLKARIVSMPEPGDNAAMFWRFYPFADAGVSHVLVRDTDSRLTPREAAAVGEWLHSGKIGHIMRDHPCHTQLMMGGMWGARAEAFRPILSWIAAFGPENLYNSDQEFLAAWVYPRFLQLGVYVHDAFYRYEAWAKPFPLERTNQSFIGEILDEYGHRPEDRTGDWEQVRLLEQSFWQRILFRRQQLRQRIWYQKKLHHIRSSGLRPSAFIGPVSGGAL